MKISHTQHWSPAIGQFRTEFYILLTSGRRLPLGESVFDSEFYPTNDKLTKAISARKDQLSDLLREFMTGEDL